MTRALRGIALALALAAIVPRVAPAQRGTTRPAPPTVIVRPPANPPVIGIVPGGQAVAPRAGSTAGGYRGGWTPGSGIGIVPRSYARPAPRNGHVPIVVDVRPRSRIIGRPYVPRSRFRGGCLGSWLCSPTVVFGVPYVAVPYGVPVAVPSEPLIYAPEPAYDVEPEPTGPSPVPAPRDSSFAHSRLIIVGGENGRGGDALTIEQLGDSVLRLTWLGSIRPIRDARVFVADSAQRTLRAQRVDATTPSALFETKELQRRIAYAGVSVTFTDGVMSSTMIPVRVSSSRNSVPPPRTPPTTR